MSAGGISHRVERLGRLAVFSVVLSAGALALAAPAAAGPCSLASPSTWSDHDGDWSAAANWTPAAVPGLGSLAGANVCVVDGSSSVNIDTNPSIGSLQIGSGNSLNVIPGQTLNIAGPSFINAGAFSINAFMGDAIVNLTGGASLSGGGTVNLNSNLGNAYLRGSGVTLTNLNNTIEGYGYIGDTGALAIVNDGTINANGGGGVTLYVNQGNGGVTNNGTLEATNVSTLALFNTITNGAAGVIKSEGSNSLVQVSGTIVGGTLTSTGGGLIETVGSADLKGVTLSAGSTYIGAPGTTTQLDGSLVNKGTLTVAGSTANAYLNIGSNLTLSGGGTINLYGDPFIVALRGSGVTLTNLNNTIEGYGYIGDTGALAIVNDGTINANGSGGLTLTVNQGNGGVTNNGTLEATNGSGLALFNTITNGAAGVINSEGTGSLVQVDGTIVGGTLTSTGGGLIETVGSADLKGVTLSAGSAYIAAPGTTTQLDGSFVNKGTLTVAGSTANAYLNIGSNLTLSGGGTISLYGDPFIVALRGSGVTLTNVNNTINGYGYIGDTGALAIVNDGTINANGSGGLTLTINQGNGGVTNNGTLEATDGSGLALFNTITNGASGVIKSEGTGSLVQVDGTIVGGTLTSTGGGLIETAGSADLKGVTLSAGSVYFSSLGSTTQLDGSFVNKGAFLLQGSIANIGSSLTLSGGGAVSLSNRVSDSYLRGAGVTLTNLDNTIEGYGYIGDNGALGFVNGPAGTLTANTFGRTLDVGAGGGAFTNQGTVTITDGATLIVDANASGFVQSRGASGAPVTEVDGTLDVPNGFNLEAGVLTGAGMIVGEVNNEGGEVTHFSPGLLTIEGDYTQGAAGAFGVFLGGLTPGTEYSLLDVTGDALLDGVLDVTKAASFRLSNKDVFAIMEFAGYEGDFTSLDYDGAACSAGEGLWNCAGGVQFLEELGPGGLALVVTDPGAPTVPEPSTWAMTLIGFAGLGFLVRRRARRGAARTAPV